MDDDLTWVVLLIVIIKIESKHLDMADALPPSNLPQDIIDRLTVDVTKGLEHWMATSTPEQRATGIAKQQQFASDPNFAA